MKYYLIAFVPDDGGFSLFSPDFPEFNSQGDSVEEAMSMAIDCLRLLVETYQEEGKALPEPCDLKTAKERIDKLLADIEFTPDGEVSYHYVPVIVASNKQVTRISVSMTKAELEEIDYKANLLGMTRSKFIVAAARAYNK